MRINFTQGTPVPPPPPPDAVTLCMDGKEWEALVGIANCDTVALGLLVHAGHHNPTKLYQVIDAIRQAEQNRREGKA